MTAKRVYFLIQDTLIRVSARFKVHIAKSSGIKKPPCTGGLRKKIRTALLIIQDVEKISLSGFIEFFISKLVFQDWPSQSLLTYK